MHCIEDIFIQSNPNIFHNSKLREPQVAAYLSAHKHFIQDKNTEDGIIVLPTGVGKTGVMALLPYSISNGKVLIITPQLTIKDTVLDAIDPTNPNNFWIKHDVFSSDFDLPNVIEYSSGLPKDILDVANIVVLNIHKLQQRLDNSPLNFLPRDYFDMIIIDEAHHSTAKTWQDTITYFNSAKVIKLTGTPFRTDKIPLIGKLIYKYTLGRAMAAEYVKSLENIDYIPEELYLTLDNDSSKEYSIEEIYALNLRDEEWVTRSVAYSKSCSEKVVDESIRLLNQKLGISPNIPHKIIGVACSIPHANQLKTLYESKGIKTTIVHSKLDEISRQRAFNDIKNHRIQAVINVAMLGEGYDHCYLSIAAIFRPFRNELPYIQFIGRILRYIPEAENAIDNIGQIISHKNLGLESLWEKYKIEINESEVIKYLKDQDIDMPDPSSDEVRTVTERTYDISVGVVKEKGTGYTASDPYITTLLLQKHREETEEFNKKVAALQQLLSVSEAEAKKMVHMSESNNSAMKRPDLYYTKTRQDIDGMIRQELVPELLTTYKIAKDSSSLQSLRIFSDAKYRWIPSKFNNNAAMLAVYFNTYLKRQMGKPREEWTIDDYHIANIKLKEAYNYIDTSLKNLVQ